MRIGPLFQYRFKSKKIEDLRYFLEVCRYVHRNPEKAGIELTQNYKWSSYQEYLGQEKIINKEVLLHYFDNNLKEFINYTLKIKDSNDAENYADFEIISKLKDEELASIIVQKLKIEDVSKISSFFKYKNKRELEKDIKKIKKIHGTNITQIARVTRVDRRRIKNCWED